MIVIILLNLYIGSDVDTFDEKSPKLQWVQYVQSCHRGQPALGLQPDHPAREQNPLAQRKL